MIISASVFWICLALLFYIFVGYPLLVELRARRRPHAVLREASAPSVSLIIVARNEQRVIARRVQNLLDLDYPRSGLEILIGSDGSTDDTARTAGRAGGARIRLFEFLHRRGKAAVLNELALRARGEILVFGDARQVFAAGALRALVAPFADAQVGAVSGELMLTEATGPSTVGRGVGLYWRYEKAIRKNESAIDSTVGATGAIYAIRRRLFEKIPPDTILDDVLIPMNAVRRGYRVVFEPEARAYDRVAAGAAEEFTRKVRTIAGNFQLLLRERWMLDPWRNRLWFQTISHKALRLLLPLLFAALLASNIALLRSPFYALTLSGQIVFYAAGAVGHGLRCRGWSVPLLAVPHVLCMLNWATLVAFTRFVQGSATVTWATVPSLPEAPRTGPGTETAGSSVRRSA